MINGYLVALVAAALWGLSYTLDQRVLITLQPTKFFFLQSLAVVAITIIFHLVSRRPVWELLYVDTRVVDYRLLGLTVVINIAASLAILASIQSLGATRASLLEITYPVFVVIFSYLIYSESINPAILLGGTLIMAGVAIIVAWN